MPHKQGTASITAGNINTNILAGWQYEYLPWPARLKLIMNAEAVTTAGAFQLATVFSGSETIMEESSLTPGATVGAIPNELNVPPIVWDAPAGDRVKVQVRNSDTATKVTNFVIYAYPLGG